MASFSKKVWPKVMSSCGPYFVCKKEQPRYDHFSKLIESEQEFLMISEIPSNSCICHAHTREAKRHRSDPKYILYGNRALMGHIITSRQKIIMPAKHFRFGSVSLCETHYQHMYRPVHRGGGCRGVPVHPFFNLMIITASVYKCSCHTCLMVDSVGVG